jgi:hypothetical protein
MVVSNEVFRFMLQTVLRQRDHNIPTLINGMGCEIKFATLYPTPPNSDSPKNHECVWQGSPVDFF